MFDFITLFNRISDRPIVRRWKKEAQEECHCRAQARHELQGWRQEQQEKRKKKAARTTTRERKKELKAVEALLRQHKSKPSGTQGRAAGEPPKKRARLEAKKRLRMILVADRCAMSGAAMSEMKTRIVEVVSDFVEVDEELGIEVSMSQDPEVAGTMYAVSIPVRGVKPQFDVENETYGWDEEPMYDDDVWEKSEAEK